MTKAILEARGLTKRYGTAYAVRDVSFSVGAGEIFGLLGPNGAGKTTTILMLLGLSDISAGTARVFGHDLLRSRNPPRRPPNCSSGARRSGVGSLASSQTSSRTPITAPAARSGTHTRPSGRGPPLDTANPVGDPVGGTCGLVGC